MPDKTDRVHVHIGIDMRGNVTLVFPMPTDRLRLPPADMRQIAALLVAKCDEAERKDRVDEEDD